MRYLRAFLTSFDAADLPIFVFILGLLLIGYGGSLIHDGLGLVLVGLLVVLYVKPLGRWVK